MTTEFISISKIDFKELKFSRTKQNTGKRFIDVFYNKKPLGIKLAKMRIPFDTQLSKYNQLEMNLSLEDPETAECFREFDRQMEKYADENSWNSENYSYTPIVKESKAQQSNGDFFPSTVRFKIQQKDSKILTSFYDQEKKRTSVDKPDDVVKLLKKGTNVASAIEVSGVWFMGDKWGVSFKVEQVMVFEPEKRKEVAVDDYLFESDDSGSEASNSCFIVDSE